MPISTWFGYLWALYILVLPLDALAAPKCDLNTVEKWKRFVAEESAKPESKDWGRVAGKMTACAADALRLSVEDCIQPLSAFATAQALQGGPGRHYKFLMTDEEYFSTRPQPAVTLPAEFQRGLPPEAEWSEIARKYNGDVIRYSSTSVDNPAGDLRSALKFKLGQLGVSSRKRALFFLRDVAPAFDQFVQFTLPEKPSDPARLIDVITVEKGQPEAQLHFIQYWRQKPNSRPDVRRQRYKEKACYECHASGLREIRPLQGSLVQQEEPALKRINEAIRSYGKTGWAGAYKPEMNGPPRGGTQGLTNCALCHNGASRGSLNATYNPYQIYHKMIETFEMPPQLAARPEFRAFFDAINLRFELVSKNQIPRSENLSPGVEAVRERMKPDDHAAALLLSTELDAAYQELTVGYQSQLQNWLRGPAGCFDRANEALRSAPPGSTPTMERPASSESRVPAFHFEDFTDRDLENVRGQATLFYLWSPRMNLSLRGLGEMAKVAEALGLDFVALRDPTVSVVEASDLFEPGELSADDVWLRPNQSRRIRRELGALHYPTLLFYNGRDFTQSLRGYDDPDTIKSIVTGWVNVGERK